MLLKDDALQETSRSRNKYVGFAVKDVLFRSSTISRLDSCVCKQAALVARLGECLLETRGGGLKGINTTAH